MVALDRRFPHIFNSKHDLAGQGDTDLTYRSRLSRVDGNRGGGNGAGGNILFPRTGHFLANAVYPDSDSINHRTQGSFLIMCTGVILSHSCAHRHTPHSSLRHLSVHGGQTKCPPCTALYETACTSPVKIRSIQQNEHTIPETASVRVQTGNEDIRYKERHVLLGELS